MMKREADISENQLLVSYGEKVCMNLLKDHTTQQNIYWATDSYADLGEEFTFYAPITLDKITSYISDEGVVATKEQYDAIIKQTPEARLCYQEMIRPRAVKSKQEQTQRAKDKAEVFTPAWICNAQNNLIDEAWFGRKDVFNHENADHTWTDTTEPIVFPEGKTWKDYVSDRRLEITCGEAPYITSRYDTTTGEAISVGHRIGLLDRKLRIVSENTTQSGEWLEWAQKALKSTYAYEWQGDSLLLAREALLVSFIEYHCAKFGHMPSISSIDDVAVIVSWNVWQMDGLKGVVPGTCSEKKERTNTLWDGIQETVKPCTGCKSGRIKEHIGDYCYIKDWDTTDPATGENGLAIRFIDLLQQ